MKCAEEQPVGELTLFAGIFCKTWSIAAMGTVLPQHAHEHPHISLIVAGSVRVWCGDEMLGDFHAPATIKVPAREKHTFLTLTGRVIIACIHAVGEADDVAIAEEHVLELAGKIPRGDLADENC